MKSEVRILTTNERIKYFRKTILKLSQIEFGEKIGMTQTGVSTFERKGATVTDSTIKSISLVFGVSEDWLRDGTEPMYSTKSSLSLHDFFENNKASALEVAIVKAYFELDHDIRQEILQHFKNKLSVVIGTDSKDQ